MNKLLGILVIAGISIIYLFVACACIISSWVEEREIKNENKYK